MSLINWLKIKKIKAQTGGGHDTKFSAIWHGCYVDQSNVACLDQTPNDHGSRVTVSGVQEA